MKKQGKGAISGGGDHEMMLKATNPTTTAKKKNGKTRSISKKLLKGKDGGNGKLNINLQVKEQILETTQNGCTATDGKFSEKIVEELEVSVAGQLNHGVWEDDDEYWRCCCVFGAVFEQMLWGSSCWWSSSWDFELMKLVDGFHHHNAFCCDVFWDDCIWDLNEFKDSLDSP
ncbi:OLC1v1032288C1 [Oldenlandia corymbosa var. corymbosa]|uniref:OLC1v1032288C1 n=1 Tax=Oldenlandia corymbosa var. corymbosa TaxID=529605 RepID=A0AAV1CL98_OLDCO|nr:OLC1v1032288C1 [Oldenlandia corymbosa var. corymbosa]